MASSNSRSREGPAAYQLEVGVEVQDDGASGGDAADQPTESVEISPGATVDGMLGGADTDDLYTLALSPNTELRLSITNDRASETAVLMRLTTEGEQLFLDRVAPGAQQDFSVLLGPDDDGLLDISGHGRAG